MPQQAHKAPALLKNATQSRQLYATQTALLGNINIYDCWCALAQLTVRNKVINFWSCLDCTTSGQDCVGDFVNGGCSATCDMPGYYYKVFRITQNKTYNGDDCDYEDGYIKHTNKPCKAEGCPGNLQTVIQFKPAHSGY